MEEALEKILDEIYEDIWGKFDNSHIGTFAEFKPSEKKIIDKYNEMPLIHAISSENVKAAMQKIQEEVNVSKRNN